MGTYTTNYQLYMPTVGETGWGTLVNGNFTTIDTTMKGLDTRLTAVENEVNGALSCTSVTTSGKITGNGGIAGTTGTFSGAVSCTKLTESNKTITVTPTNNYGTGGYDFTSEVLGGQYSCLLPPVQGKTYTGTVRFYSQSGGQVDYFTTYTASQRTYLQISSGNYGNITLNGAKMLYARRSSSIYLCDFTLS